MWKNRVLWCEGQFLRPQHLQQQERFLENTLDARLGATDSFPFGFTHVELDRGALSRGVIQLNAASGVLSDGTPFSFPAEDPPPAPLSIGHDVKDRLVLLAAPLSRPGVPSTSFDPIGTESLARYESAEVDVTDVNEGFTEPTMIQVARLRPRLLLTGPADGAYSALGVCRIVERRADGQIELDADYVPPALHVGSAPGLARWLTELRGLLAQRSETMAMRMAEPGRGGVGEISDFLFLLAVNRWRPLLEHLASIPRLHPERLYSVCVQLLGELSTFDTERWLKVPLPAYDHHDLARTFRPVIAQLRLALGRPMEQSAIPLPLQDLKHGVRVAVLADKSLLNTAGFVLAVGAQMSSDALRQRFAAQTKVGPIERLRDLVTLQLPGIGLRALPVAPRQIPYHAGLTYFELDVRSELWRQLERSGGIGMHVAGDFPGLELEFWAIRQ